MLLVNIHSQLGAHYEPTNFKKNFLALNPIGFSQRSFPFLSRVRLSSTSSSFEFMTCTCREGDPTRIILQSLPLKSTYLEKGVKHLTN